MVGKRFTEARRPVGLKVGLVGGAEPVKEVEPTGEAEPVELEAEPVNRGLTRLGDSPLHTDPGMYSPRF